MPYCFVRFLNGLFFNEISASFSHNTFVVFFSLSLSLSVSQYLFSMVEQCSETFSGRNTFTNKRLRSNIYEACSISGPLKKNRKRSRVKTININEITHRWSAPFETTPYSTSVLWIKHIAPHTGNVRGGRLSHDNRQDETLRSIVFKSHDVNKKKPADH